MNVDEFLEVTTHNFYNILSDGITGMDIIKMLRVLSVYAATLCKTDSQFTKLFLVLFDKSQDVADELLDEIITIDTSKIKPT